MTGKSMEPELSGGDIIALEAIEDASYLISGEIYAIVTKNGLRTVKRLRVLPEPGHYELVPTNKEYEPQEITSEEILKVYRVMGSIKRF